MSRMWEAVAKSLRTFLDVGIRKIGPCQGLVLKPSSPSGSKADTERLTTSSSWDEHNQRQTVNFSRDTKLVPGAKSMTSKLFIFWGNPIYRAITRTIGCVNLTM